MVCCVTEVVTIIPSSFDRARTALGAAYQKSRRQRPRKAER
jgi:hypothetical protein